MTGDRSIRSRLGRLALGLSGSLFGAIASAAPALQHGPFEIVMSTRRIGAGGFPNTSGNPFRTTTVSSFEVRLGGKRVEIPGRGNAFRAALRIEGAPQPALLVNDGPMHLLTTTEGRLRVQSLGGDMATLQWLDSRGGQPGPVLQFGPALQQLEADTWLRGGRLLLVDRRFVIDVSTLAVQAVEPWIVNGLNASTTSAVATSPRATLFAMPASGPSGADGNGEGVLVIDVGRGGTQGVPVDAKRPKRDPGEPEAEWFARHFEWTEESDRRERLRARPEPLPWKKRGVLVRFGPQHEYHVRRVRPELGAALARVVEQQFAGRAEADVGAHGAGHYALPSCGYRLRLAVRDGGLTLVAPTPAEAPWNRCQDEIVRIAAAFDAELAAGRHDALLLP
jgi:hypothetical protein